MKGEEDTLDIIYQRIMENLPAYPPRNPTIEDQRRTNDNTKTNQFGKGSTT